LLTDVLDRKESLLIVGESGTGKSSLLNQVIFSLAVPPEKGLWEKFKIRRPVTCLLVQSENSMAATSFRLKRLFKAHPEFLQHAGFRVMTFKIGDDIRMSGDLRNKAFQKKIVDALVEIQADVMAIDPLISFHESDENSNVEMRASLDALTAICDQANVACIVTHHTGKNGDSRGASAIKDWVANQIKLTREQTQDPDRYILRVHHDKARNFPTIPDFFLERTPNFDFVLTDPISSTKDEEMIEAVVQSLASLGGKVDSQSQLVSEVVTTLNCGATWAKKAIALALKAGKVRAFSGGHGRTTGYLLPTN